MLTARCDYPLTAPHKKGSKVLFSSIEPLAALLTGGPVVGSPNWLNTNHPIASGFLLVAAQALPPTIHRLMVFQARLC